MTPVEARLIALVAAGEPFTADDVTGAGALTLDGGTHAPNAKQSGIGSLFRSYATQGRITFTGRIVASRAPHRKGGAIRVWQPTAHGQAWATALRGKLPT